MVLFAIFLCANAVFIAIYIISQVILVLIALNDRWSLGNTKNNGQFRNFNTFV